MRFEVFLHSEFAFSIELDDLFVLFSNRSRQSIQLPLNSDPTETPGRPASTYEQLVPKSQSVPQSQSVYESQSAPESPKHWENTSDSEASLRTPLTHTDELTLNNPSDHAEAMMTEIQNRRTANQHLSHVVIPFDEIVFLEQVRTTCIHCTTPQIEAGETCNAFRSRWLGKDVVVKVLSGYLVDEAAW